MNNCQQRAWFWKMGGSCNSIWLLLETEGAWFITKPNLSTVFSTDYIFLCFLSRIRFYAHGFILPLLQSLGRNHGLITFWTGNGCGSQNCILFWDFPLAHGRIEVISFNPSLVIDVWQVCWGAEAVTVKRLFSSSSGRSSSWIQHSAVPCKT